MANNEIQILQFGTGNFLRAFFGSMVQDLNDLGNNLSICAIQSTSSQSLYQLKAQGYEYNLLVAGYKAGKKIEQISKITCIKDGLRLPDEKEKFMEFATLPQVKWIISNVTEAGMVIKEEGPFEEFAESFAGRLTQWLFKRFQVLPQAETIILPCELLPKNGDLLKSFIQKHSENWNLEPKFLEWLEHKCRFFNSLVDRIVPGFPSHLDLKEKESDAFLVQTEPYCFWAIEGTEKDRANLPFIDSTAEVVLKENIDFYSLRKIRILNGLHTFMAAKGLLNEIETVGDYVRDSARLRELYAFLQEEIFSTLDAPLSELNTYAEQVIDRFKNPFVSHKLADISLNSVAKFKSRLLPIFKFHLEQKGTLPPIGSQGLVALILFYLRSPERIHDTQDVKAYFKKLEKQPSELDQVQFVVRDLFGLEDSIGIRSAYQSFQ